MDTVRLPSPGRPADADTRNRPVVLDTGPLPPPTAGLGRVARTVLQVAIVAVLAAGAIAAGGWSIMTAADGSTPSSDPSPLWWTPSPENATPSGGGQGATEPRQATPAATPTATPAAPKRTAAEDRGGGTGRATAGATGGGGRSPDGRTQSTGTRRGRDDSAGDDRDDRDRHDRDDRDDRDDKDSGGDDKADSSNRGSGKSGSGKSGSGNSGGDRDDSDRRSRD
jgi:hypothetical protein